MNDVTKDLLEALKAVMPYVVTQVVACHGLKCRESVCESCTHDAEGNADKALYAYQAASKAIARAEAARAAPQPDADERRLRRMLCLHRHGASAYMDDGEASFGGDAFQRPTDYLREPLDSIEQAWREAGLKQAQAALTAPQPDADGWIPWAGGECPVAPNRISQVKLRCGMTIKAGEGLRWSYEGSLGDIIAYRVVEAKP